MVDRRGLSFFPYSLTFLYTQGRACLFTIAGSLSNFLHLYKVKVKLEYLI